MPLPWHMLVGLIIKVLVFFLLNCCFSSAASPGSTQVLGKKSNSPLKNFWSLPRFLAKEFLRLNA